MAAVLKKNGLGLDAVGDLAGLLKSPTPAANGAADGTPLMMDCSVIHEDPHQPRRADNPGFTHESIAELASTIGPKGIKTPISVRQHPDLPGHFYINHGHRRYRATVFKGLTTIPAFVDNDYSETDQVIENLQRNELTAREIADYIGREIAAGKKKADIAKALGKSAPFVSQHVALLDLPEPLATVFSSGRCRDVTVINELLKAHKANADAVAEWLNDENMEITRGSVSLLREFIDAKKSGADGAPPDSDSKGAAGDGDGGEGEDSPAKQKKADPTKLKKAIVQVKLDDRPARLLTDRRPSALGLAWFKYDDDGAEVEADVGKAVITALVEG